VASCSVNHDAVAHAEWRHERVELAADDLLQLLDRTSA
jgi:hypothetical protein